MGTKRTQRGKKPSPEWLTTSEAARYLGVSVDKIRELDESGELRASRTKGKHRRFSRKALDAYLARNGRRIKRSEESPRPRSRPVSPPERDPEPFDEDPEAFEPGDEEPSLEESPPPPPPLNPLEKFAREREERRKREENEAPLRRLATLKQYGLTQIGWGVPDSWHPKVAAALEGYATLKTFPAWVSDVDAYRIVRGKVEEVLQPYHDEVARKKVEEARREEEATTNRRQQEEEAEEQQRVQQVIDDGMRHARKQLSDWELEDRARALRDVERMLKDSVEVDWTEQDAKDAVDDELDDLEDDEIEPEEEEES